MLSARTLVLLGLLLGAAAWAASGLLRSEPEAPAGIPTLDQRARAIAPEVSCAPPERAAETGPSPRCVIPFPRAVGALGVPAEGTPAVVSLVHSATGSWALPAATYLTAFDPLPAEVEARAVLASGARDVALFAVGPELQRYALSTGRLQARAPGPGGAIADLDWTADGALMAVVAGGKAYVLDSGGKVARELPVDGGALLATIAPDGSRAAVASDAGAVSLFDLASDAPPRVVTPSLQPASGLALASGLLWVAGSDGTLRGLDPSSGDERTRTEVGAPLLALAVSADGTRAATAGRDHAVRVHALPSGEVTATLAWHPSRVVALGFGAGATLLSADADGHLAVWDLGVHR